MNMRQFSSSLYTVLCNPDTSGAWDALSNAARYPASASFIDMSGFDRACFMIACGSLADSLTFKPYADTSATETANIVPIDTTNLTKTLTASTHNGKVLFIEFSAANVAALNTALLTYRYITLVASDISGNNYAAIMAFLWRGKNLAVTQPSSVLTPIVLGG